MPDPVDQEQYEVAVLAGIALLVASIQRGGQLLEAYPDQAEDATYREAACAEFRTWRTHLAALPEQAPPMYRTVLPGCCAGRRRWRASGRPTRRALRPVI